MRYKSGLGNVLVGNEAYQTDFRPKQAIVTKFITLSPSGYLRLYNGFPWDGVSGAIDTKTNMKAGQLHDALYYLMRHGRLDCKDWRMADNEYAKQYKEDGGWAITINAHMLILKLAGGKYASPKNIKEIKVAP